jgi:hypothetical protein
LGRKYGRGKYGRGTYDLGESIPQLPDTWYPIVDPIFPDWTPISEISASDIWIPISGIPPSERWVPIVHPVIPVRV